MSELNRFPSAKSFGLPERGERFVQEARNNVAKAVRATPGVSCTRYPSRKTGYVKVLPSRTAEFPSAIELEINPKVTEYWDQPGKLKLTYESKSGHKVSPLTTPDKLYHHAERGWIIREDKHRAKIELEAEKSPHRYIKKSDGTWICPPGIEAAKRYGMDYEVNVPDLANEVLFRNAMWLEDYFLESAPEPNSETETAIRKLLSSNGGCIKLSEVIDRFDDPAPIYRSIALQDLHFDIHRDLICRPERAWLYTDKATAIAWQHIHGSRPIRAIGFSLLEGDRLKWNRNSWTVIALTNSGYTLESSEGHIVTLTSVQMHQLIDNGEVEQQQASELDERALALLKNAGPDDLAIANHRADVLRTSGTDGAVVESISTRTLRRWKKAFRIAESLYGIGYLGLLPKHRRKGNRAQRISTDRESMIDLSLNEDFLSDESMTLYQAYALYVARSREEKVDPVAYETYRKRALNRGVIVRLKARHGRKAAYLRAAPMPKSSIPVDGDRPWEVAHLDHTQLDIKLVSGVSGEPLGNPWMTLLIDAKTHEPLARYLSLEKPSKVAVMMVLRDCVYRHNRLPQRIVVDQGAEFNSIYFDTFLASQFVTKLSRPDSEPRFGAMGERMNGIITSKFLRLLKGNSRVLKDPRSMSKSHDPRELAIWTPDSFLKAFDQFLFEEYPLLRQKETHESPRDRYSRLMSQAGSRPSRYIPFDKQFLIMTMLEPATGMRQVHSYGVSINNLRYWAEELKPYVLKKKKYYVKYDPMNLNHAFIFIAGDWLEMTCTSPIVAEYNELGLDQAFVELMARARVTSREYRSMPESYARFVLECKRNEEFLAGHHELLSVGPESEDPADDEAVPDVVLTDEASFDAETLIVGA